MLGDLSSLSVSIKSTPTPNLIYLFVKPPCWFDIEYNQMCCQRAVFQIRMHWKSWRGQLLKGQWVAQESSVEKFRTVTPKTAWMSSSGAHLDSIHINSILMKSPVPRIVCVLNLRASKGHNELSVISSCTLCSPKGSCKSNRSDLIPESST